MFLKNRNIISKIKRSKVTDYAALSTSSSHLWWCGNNLSHVWGFGTSSSYVWLLRTYATKYFPFWNMFNTLHTVCCMHGLSIYEIKGICHHAYFFIISFGSFLDLTNFPNRWKNNTVPKYRADIVVIFSQLLSFNLHYCPWPQTF